MAKIEATGIHNGTEIDVEVTMIEGHPTIKVWGVLDASAQIELDKWNAKPPLMGGTYQPKPFTMLSTVAVLEQNFFDNRPTIKVTGDIEEIPSVPDGAIA